MLDRLVGDIIDDFFLCSKTIVAIEYLTAYTEIMDFFGMVNCEGRKV